MNNIIIKGAKVHNLKNVSVTLPRNAFIVFTGLSGSGKSSLAFDTIFAEGQRRYMESLSAYARQFLDQMDKPDVEVIEGLSPAISIDQKSASHNPRSTVGTVTEIYDYFRILFSSIGTPHCWSCQQEIKGFSIQEMADTISKQFSKQSVLIMSPLISEKKGEYKTLFEQLIKQGFSRIDLNGTITRLDEVGELAKNKKHTINLVVDRMTVDAENQSRLFESLETAVSQSKGLALVQSDQHRQLFSEKLSCPTCNTNVPELSPRLFSFNSPIGACKTCNGLGSISDFDPELIIQNPEAPLRYAAPKLINMTQLASRISYFQLDFDLNTPYSKLSDLQKQVLFYGNKAGFQGIIPAINDRYKQTHHEGMRFFFRQYMSQYPCPTCKSGRLREESLAVKVHGHALPTLMAQPISSLKQTLLTLPLTEKEKDITKQLIKEIQSRLGFLNDVGLGYLTLDRAAATLSGGEFQRIRLATQIGSGLTGVLYVLDEPSIGLHQRDNLKLIAALKRLQALGNTLIIVEHDEDTIKQADFIVEIGPGAGQHGGNIQFAGKLTDFLKKAKTITADYLNQHQKIEVPKKRRNPENKGVLTISGVIENNLKNITVNFPLGCFIGITGVSGSGKSTLIYDVLHKALMRHFYKSKERVGQYKAIKGLEHLDKVITIDQSPIGRTPRSNPATYSGVFTPIRDLFAQTKTAKIKGYKAGRFSFNVKGGRCESCEGDGVMKIEMHFLSDVYVTCELCKGKRYNNETLEVTYKGKTISDVLHMTIDDNCALFESIPSIREKLAVLQEVGLGYIQLGQSATTLSGGEAQRIKLAKELSKRSTGKTLYILDEPTTGLHFEDVKKLLHVLHRLVDVGNTVVVIEHHLDVIKTVDHIIDLGPEGGEKGGHIIAFGTPEQVSKSKKSHTATFLKELLT